MQLSKGARAFGLAAAGVGGVVVLIHAMQRWQRETMKAGPKRDEARYQRRLAELSAAQQQAAQQPAAEGRRP
ncbi:hypothetical protein Rsub_02154 [Raphidocelis subcapitata]|uniref:Uncharacterized protein n=1 Tax=Raphidocelis subcapitata TaxID=307507 RepID=A0A2V0NWG0_9CHLO|nr:hypothetical protein Rsub_02154 [Raphidocelis subcapitata]|eukprot:GBF89277.1 hypothetical protein Rsub_02154 [Raphidocelis subcapitata]